MSSLRVFAALVALGGSLASVAHADAVVTLKGRRVEGDIISETKSEIQLRTQYGDLTFRKLDLQEIVRTSAAPALPDASSGATNNDPFGPSSAAPAPGPFDGGFGAPASGGPNPFAPKAPVNNPFAANPGGTNPLATNANPLAPNVGTANEPSPFEAVVKAAAAGGGANRQEIQTPEVPFSWDAVLFDIPESGKVVALADPGQPKRVEVNVDTPLRAGAQIESGATPARIVFKNGADMLRLTPKSSVTIVESTPESVVVELKRGSIWADASTASVGKHSFVIRTSQVTVNVPDGSMVRVSDALDQGLHVAAALGSVQIIPSKVQMQFEAAEGQMVMVRPDGAMPPATKLSDYIVYENNNWNTLAADWWNEMTRLAGNQKSIDAARESTLWPSINELQPTLRKVADAFVKFAEDTGHVPTPQEGFSVLAQNTGKWDGWKGPYWDGVLPPLDSWGRPMRYNLRDSGGSSKKLVGIVYSIGEDNTDSKGNPSGDLTELVLYYQLESIAQDPKYKPAP